MKMICNVPDEVIKSVRMGTWCGSSVVEKMIANGTPIPDNATNERMVGKWIKSRDCYGNNHFTCPFCEHDIATQYADKWDDNYCSNCGARMEGMEYE